VEKIKERLTVTKGEPNVFVLTPDKFLSLNGNNPKLSCGQDKNRAFLSYE
jgi:hypothetical protein